MLKVKQRGLQTRRRVYVNIMEGVGNVGRWDEEAVHERILVEIVHGVAMRGVELVAEQKLLIQLHVLRRLAERVREPLVCRKQRVYESWLLVLNTYRAEVRKTTSTSLPQPAATRLVPFHGHPYANQSTGTTRV